MDEDFGYLLQRRHVFVRHMGNATLNAHASCWLHKPFEGQGRDDAKVRLLSYLQIKAQHIGRGKCYQEITYA